MKEMFESLIGKGLGPRRIDYTWRDTVLYALGVGAHIEDLDYIYEKNLKAIPTFGVIPYLNSVIMSPLRSIPYAPHTLVANAIEAKTGKMPGKLHMAMDLVMHRPIDPMSGTLLCEDKVAAILDRGEKGIAVETQMDISDIAGRSICTAKGTHAVMACGNFGGEMFKSPKLDFPDREPDYVLKDHMAETQAALYRLMGDTYTVHIDPDTLKGKFKAPFMQGLCTFGYACRLGIMAVIPGEPERMTHLYAQMRSLCYPGSDIIFKAWNADGKLYFRLDNDEGKAVLDNGIFEYR